jgi:membrane associated rhomboid family serine protease
MVTETSTCYRHHDRRAGVSCQRCGRPICPSCMIPASVGFHCPECARSGRQVVKTGPAAFAQGRQVATIVLIALNVAVFLVDAVTARGAGLLAGGNGELTFRGLLVGYREPAGVPIGVAEGEWWRIFTSGFLHYGLLHLAMNMLVLWILGSQLERAIGPLRYVTLYLTSLIAGSLGVLLISPTDATVGASGAVFGLMGAAFALQRASGVDPWRSGLGTLIILNLVITFAVPGISIGGHIGGLVGGALAGFLIFQLDRRTSSALPAVAACAAVAGAFFVACLWAAERYADPIFGFIG